MLQIQINLKTLIMDYLINPSNESFFDNQVNRLRKGFKDLQWKKLSNVVVLRWQALVQSNIC